MAADATKLKIFELPATICFDNHFFCFPTVCDVDGQMEQISVGVDDDAVVGVGVHGQGVNLGVSLGVGIVVGPPPSLPSTLRGPV